MISLDQKILDPHSKVAERMRAFSAVDIVIPSGNSLELNLSETVTAQGTGGNKISQFFGLIRLGKKLQNQNSYDLITTQDPFLTALSGLFIRGKEKLEIQVHGDFFSAKYFRNTSLKNFVYYWLARLVTLPRADKIRVVGERVKQSVLYLGIAEEKIEVRSVAFDPQAVRNYQPQKDAKKEYNGFGKYFAYVGRLEVEKNVAWLIRTFDRYLRETDYSDVFLIIGDGSQKKYLEKLVKKLGREKNILFVGWLTQPFDYLKTVDCVLVPSLAEGYGLTAMETAATNTKLIMTDVGVANYELLPSEKVIIVPVNDQVAFISALKKV